MSLLEIDSVHFSYGNRQILSSVYLKVSKGEVVGFLGNNGCGKSTLLKVIFGSLKGASQSVRISGKYHHSAFQSGLIKFLPQEGLFPHFLTAKKAAKIYQADVRELLADAEFERYQNYKFSAMSGGIAKYLETLIVLHSPCDFVLLDEPFSFIAPILVERLIPAIKKVSQDKGILLTDHQYKSILRASDRLYLLRGQCLYSISDTQDLMDMGYIH